MAAERKQALRRRRRGTATPVSIETAVDILDRRIRRTSGEMEYCEAHENWGDYRTMATVKEWLEGTRKDIEKAVTGNGDT